MDRGTWERVRELFYQSTDVSAGDLDAWLDHECADAPEVRRELARLLPAAEAPSEWLSPPGEVGWLTPRRYQDLQPGTRLGPYRLRSLIGTGGMGAVYCAEQEHPKRLVAIKTLRTDLADEGLLRRFRTEAEILGKLRHPGIAQIYEAGTHVDADSSVPYLVMEYVEGAHGLVEHADRKGLDRRQRLELFLAVCEAVHHGHQKGVIHRDLKPGNVLVDAEGRLKVIDFGLARPLDPQDFEFSFVQTRAGEILGTLAYMSPEHVSGKTFDIDTRSDVYSLGCILCELLTGAPPHDLAGLPLPVAVRRIAEAVPVIAGRLSGDLRWILERALAPEPERRYASASELAADVRRFLDREPVAAGPPSTFYRLTRFASRHRAVLVGVTAVIVALSIGLLQASREARKARESSAAFEQQARVARIVSIFLTDLFDGVTAYRAGRDARVIDAIEMAERKLPTLEEPTVRAILAGIVGKGFLTLDERERAEPLIEEAALSLRELVGPDDLDRLNAEVVYADLLEVQQRVEESRRLSEELLPRLERVVGPAHDLTDYLRYNLAVCCQRQGDFERAEELFLVNLENTATLGDGPRSTSYMNLLHRVGTVRHDQGRLTEARADIEQALELARTLGGVSPLYEATFLMDLAGVRRSLGDEAGALDDYRKVDRLYARLQPTASNRFEIASCLGWSLLANGATDEAARQLGRARTVLEEEWSETGFRHVEILRLEATIASASGEHGLAAAAASEALHLAETVLSEGTHRTAACQQTLVEVLLAGERADEACEFARALLDSTPAEAPEYEERRALLEQAEALAN